MTRNPASDKTTSRRANGPAPTAEALDIRGAVAERARVVMGLGPGAEDRPRGLRRSPSGAYPAVALGLLAMTAEMHVYGLAFLGPDMRRELGMGAGTLILLRSVGASLAALRMARNFQQRDDRVYMTLFTACTWTLLTAALAFAVGSPTLFVLGMGWAAASVHALHPSLLADSYPPALRARAVSYYRAFAAVGLGLAAVVAVVAMSLGFTWRAGFLAMGAISALAVAFAARLRDPGFGRWDVEPVKDLVRAAAAAESNGAARQDSADAPQADATGVRGLRRLLAARRPPECDYFTFPDVAISDTAVECRGFQDAAAAASRRLKFGEVTQRLFGIPTLRVVFTSWALLGMLLTPMFGYVSFFLEDRLGLGFGARGGVWIAAAAATFVALLWFAPQAERRFQQDPGAFLRFGARMLAGGVVAVAVGVFVPSTVAAVTLLVVGLALIGLVQPVLTTTILAVVAPRMRPHATALAAVFMSVVGALGGTLLLGGIDRRFGIAVAIASLTVPGLVVSLQLRRAASTVVADIEAFTDEVVNAEELDVRARRGEHVPLLSCRNIDFAYGRIQVLFDVNFTVDEGEMVALLGTNGSGKSTLLNVISGVGLPMRGSVIYEGNDIAYLDASRRVALGVAMVPGGKAVFGPMTVAENLRMLGYTIRHDKRRIDDAIDRCFETFPRLAERRNQLASTLSGGEQQMLGLSTALMLQPKLLLIDELSLGLAPVVVAQLLDAVRLINAQGTAVVLVEQSVNIALTLVEHAYFMEKGEIRFDGPASELLERPDLVRSVFLKGAGAGVADMRHDAGRQLVTANGSRGKVVRGRG
ncbi:MAG: MFS transporter [Actinobacteria bacterium]|nr:MFS transporter [Actinomycetota bacterium]